MLLLVSLALARPLAECERPFTSAELIEAADIAERRFANQDPPGFDEAQATVHERLGCTKDPLSPIDVIRVQRVMALSGFFAGDEARMRAAVGAMVRVDVTARFPEEVVPRGHRLDRLLDELAGSPNGEGPMLATFSDGWIEVNGAYAPNVDGSVACTLQRLDNQGQVLDTRYWQPGESLGGVAGRGGGGGPASRGEARPAHDAAEAARLPDRRRWSFQERYQQPDCPGERHGSAGGAGGLHGGCGDRDGRGVRTRGGRESARARSRGAGALRGGLAGPGGWPHLGLDRRHGGERRTARNPRDRVVIPRAGGPLLGY
jgi:hypothetical protein